MYVDLSKNELICKIVYFGPGLSGKTTNLDYLQQNAPSQRTTDLVHVDRDGERTLAFSLYPDHPPEASGMQIRVDLLTVPGRAYYITNRRDILDGADGIVFIADSRREAIDENIDAMNDMWSFINHNKLARDIPIVIQFNKQDLESAIPREQLDPLMNSQNHPAFSGIATTGEGVIETMQAILEQALPRITDPERITAEIEHAQTMGGSSEPRQHIVSSAFHLGEEEEETWLLTCYHCDAVLEVVDVHKGDLFACGSCNSMLEVMDPNTGETRPAPDPTTPLRNTAATTPTTPHSKTPVLPSSIDPTPSSGPNALAELPQLPGLDVRDQVDACLLGIRYHAVQSSDGRAMRVLVLDPVLLRQPGYSDTIEPHARRARAIRHNHILPCLDLQHWGSTPFFVSEQPEGYEPLDLLLARRRKLAPPQAMGIIRQLAQALEEAERHDVHHGWIRPEVILINEAGQILLDELAVAKHPAYILRESMGGSASTEYYLAPEHLQPDVMPDSRTDIFMLGALLFRMICGEGLVTGYTAHEALHKVITNGPRHLRDANPDISRELDNFSMRLVSVDRKDRLQRHSDLLATLENFGGGAHRGTMRINRKPTVASVSARNSMAGSAMGPHVTGVPRGMQGRTTTGANRPPPRTATAPSGSSKRQRKPTFGPLLLVALLALLATLVYFQREEIRAWQRHETPASTPPTQPAPIVIPKAESEPAQELIAKAKAQLTAVEADPGDVDARQALLALLADMRRAPVQELRDAAATLRIRLDHIPVPESEPTPEPTQPEATPTAQQKREAEVAELQQRIRKLLPQGRYGEASSLVGQLPDEQLRRTMMESIRQLHTQARQALRKQALAVSDEAALATILATAERWRMPDDADWLQALRQEAQAALQQDETDAASAQVDDGRPPLATLNGIPIDIIIADMQIDAALKQRDFTRANAIANNLPSDDPRALALALAHKVELAQQAQQVMATALEQHTGPFRVATPFGEQRWDVTDITDGGLEVRSPSDEKLSFGWSQVKADELARLYFDLAKAGSQKPLHHAIATVSLLVGGQHSLASLASTMARKLSYQRHGLLEHMIALGNLHAAARLIQRGEQALETGDAAALQQIQESLQKSRWTFPELEQARKRFDPDYRPPRQDPDTGSGSQDQAAAIGAEEVAESAPEALAPTQFDNVDFSKPQDLAALPQRRGVWRIEDGQLLLMGSYGSAARNDLTDAAGCSLTMINGSPKGSISATFRGTTVLMDYAQGGFTVSNDSGTSGFTSFPLIADIPYTLAFQLQGAVMQIVVNQARSLKFAAPSRNDQLRIEASGGQGFAIQQLIVQRSNSSTAPDSTWQPIGPAQRRDDGWHLPEPEGQAAAILRTLEPETMGFRVLAAGDGPLAVRLGDLDNGQFYEVDVSLPADGSPLPITISWRDSRISIASGTEDQSRQLVDDALPSHPHHVMLQARRELTILENPVAIR